MKKNFKLLLFTLIMGGGFFASEAMALDQVDGVYQIGTAQDLIAFANNVVNNGTNCAADAVLTADIDMSDKTWTPIGNTSNVYVGTFDGQGYRISHLTINTNNSYQGLFGVVTDGVYIKNVFVDNTCSITGGDYTAGIVGGSNGGSSNAKKVRIENCGNEATVNGGANTAGIFGCNMNGSASIIIKNCYNAGTVTGSRESGAISGWLGGGWSNVSNTYNTGNVFNGTNACTDFGRENGCGFTNCYYLSTTGTSAQSSVTSVTADDISNGTLRNNLNSDQPYFFQRSSDSKPLPLLFCRKKASDGYYELSNAEDVKWFSERVWTYRYNELGASDVSNDDCNAPLNARLTADIDFSGVRDYRPIGGLWGNGGTRYTGTFDGQGYSITNLTINNGYDNQGFFGVISNGAVIKNTLLDKTCSIQAKTAVGFIGKVWKSTGGDVNIQNCGNEASITSNGGVNAGGIYGVNQDNGGYVVVHMTNCFNIGKISGTDSGGLTGWTGNNAVVENCYTAGSYSTTDFFARTGSGTTLTNCYTTGSKDGVNSINNNQLANGNLCYLLNNSSSENPVWHQTIGTDAYPVPFSINHMVVLEDDGDYFNTLLEVANANDLTTFASNYNSGSYTGYYKVRLTSDIDFGNISFPGIGTKDKLYLGTIDGQRHKISNLTMNFDREGVGFINSATAGATIKNLTIASSCSFTGSKAVGAFVGGIWDNSGIVKFLNCGNEGTVISNGVNAGGILGCNFNGDIAIHMTNCYNIGTVQGNESAGISGWLGYHPVLRNCYNMGAVSGNDYFARMNNSDISLTNCYDSQSTWDALSSTKDGINVFDVATVFTTCFDDAQGGSVWRMEFSGTPHPVLYDAAIVYKDDFPNRPVAQENVEVKVVRPFEKENWNTVCLPFGMNNNQVKEVFGSEAKVAALTGCDGTTLKFTTTDGIIEAGKPYLVYPTKDNLSDFTISGVNVEGSTITGIVQGGLTFMGTLQPTQVYAATDYGMTSGNTIKKANDGTIKGFRAFFRQPQNSGNSEARATNFVIDDETTTVIADDLIIDNVRQNGSSKIYDLSGRQITSGQLNKGLYIVNGKKYLK